MERELWDEIVVDNFAGGGWGKHRNKNGDRA